MSSGLAISHKQIESRIFTVRGFQVVIDRDLAEMYHVETKVMNQAVKRNIERFPEIFRFQLTEKESKDFFENYTQEVVLNLLEQRSRSQFVTLNNKRGPNIKYMPYVFTEQGVAIV